MEKRCTHCQKPFGNVWSIVTLKRHQHETKKQVWFCNREHAMAWKKKIGKRFVRWEGKSW